MRRFGGVLLFVGLALAMFHYHISASLFSMGVVSAVQSAEIYTKATAAVLSDIALILAGIGLVVMDATRRPSENKTDDQKLKETWERVLRPSERTPKAK